MPEAAVSVTEPECVLCVPSTLHSKLPFGWSVRHFLVRLSSSQLSGAIRRAPTLTQLMLPTGQLIGYNLKKAH